MNNLDIKELHEWVYIIDKMDDTILEEKDLTDDLDEDHYKTLILSIHQDFVDIITQLVLMSNCKNCHKPPWMKWEINIYTLGA